MDNQPQEIEFKFAVDHSGAFKQLLEYLDTPADQLENAAVQINHFFDTQQLSLHANGTIVRLREQHGTYKLTVKGKAQTETGESALTVRIEHEAEIDAETGHGCLSSRKLSLAILKKALSGHADELNALLTQSGVEGELSYIGQFKNRRFQLPLTLQVQNVPHELIMELDTSEFPGRDPDYEIEVEISSQTDAAAIQQALEQLLKDAGIDWHTTTNKAARFFDSLRN